MKVLMWFLRFFNWFILMCMLMLEIKFCKVVFFICFLLLIVLMKIIVFCIFLVKFVNLCCNVLFGVILGLSIFFKLMRWNMIFRKKVISCIIYEIRVRMGFIIFNIFSIWFNIFMVFIIIILLFLFFNFFIDFYKIFMSNVYLFERLFVFFWIFCIIKFLVLILREV